MTNGLSISVIIPAYNVEEYVGAALQSLKEQTELPDEIIVLDDGSTDGTLSVVNSFDFSCGYKVISTVNKGQGLARNRGIDYASSDYIYFFDADDLLATNFVKHVKWNLNKKRCPDILLFSGISFADSVHEPPERELDYSRRFEGEFSSAVSLINSAGTKNRLACSPCLYVSKRSLWGKGRLQFEGNYFEDDALFYPLLFSCESFVVIDECLFFRRNRSGSTMTMKSNERHVNGALNCLRTTVDLYDKSGKTRQEKDCIAKRVEGFSLAYIRQCNKTGTKVFFASVFDALMITKSPVHLAKIILYFVEANDSVLIRSLAKKIRGGVA